MRYIGGGMPAWNAPGGGGPYAHGGGIMAPNVAMGENVEPISLSTGGSGGL